MADTFIPPPRSGHMGYRNYRGRSRGVYVYSRKRHDYVKVNRATKPGKAYYSYKPSINKRTKPTGHVPRKGRY
jgi:hypothetical protein